MTIAGISADIEHEQSIYSETMSVDNCVTTYENMNTLVDGA